MTEIASPIQPGKTHLRYRHGGLTIDYRVMSPRPDTTGNLLCESPSGEYILIPVDSLDEYEQVRPYLTPPESVYFYAEYGDGHTMNGIGAPPRGLGSSAMLAPPAAGYTDAPVHHYRYVETIAR